MHPSIHPSIHHHHLSAQYSRLHLGCIPCNNFLRLGKYDTLPAFLGRFNLFFHYGIGVGAFFFSRVVGTSLFGLPTTNE